MGGVEFEGLVDALVDALRRGSHTGYLDARTALLRAHKPINSDDPASGRCIDCNRPAIRYCPACYGRVRSQATARAR
jgi:hypothetical protein